MAADRIAEDNKKWKKNAGIRTIWFNPSHEKTSEIIPDHEFDSLMKLPELLSHI